jgi:hypothetical protein
MGRDLYNSGQGWNLGPQHVLDPRMLRKRRVDAFH